MFCEHIKELFETVFESVAKEASTEQSITNNIDWVQFFKGSGSALMTRSIMNPYADLSYDIFRRIIQFGKINETDATKLVRLVFYSEIYS